MTWQSELAALIEETMAQINAVDGANVKPVVPLIVDFANVLRSEGHGVREAIADACRIRLRPILMTSFAFMLGCVPLWTASGAGSVARQIMGTAVIGGMLAATAIGIFFIPAIFYAVERVSGATRERGDAPEMLPSPGQGD